MLNLLFIAFRITDIATTLLNTAKYGADVEGNKLQEALLNGGLFIPYQVFVTLLIVLINHTFNSHGESRIITTIMIGVIAMSALVSISNFVTYLLT